jgi:serine/threonine-protein kinase
MAELHPGLMVNDSVRLISPIGEGGMGSVWLADHMRLEAKVAVKFISPAIAGKDPSLLERFKREAALCAQIRSVHVVQTFDHGLMTDGTPYIVMELLEGTSLTHRIENDGPMQPHELHTLLVQVGMVLERAHGLGIVHRDIKPDNIFLVDDDYELFAKVLDFGLAKRTDDKGAVVTRTGMIMGSPQFMSPEQAVNSKDVDFRTDIWSLGVVCYYALTGHIPFDANDGNGPVLVRMARSEFKAVTLHVPTLPSALDAWFRRVLHSRPTSRFESVAEMVKAFHAASESDADDDGATLIVRDGIDKPAQFDLFDDDAVDATDPASEAIRAEVRRLLPTQPDLGAAKPVTTTEPVPASDPARVPDSEPSAGAPARYPEPVRQEASGSSLSASVQVTAEPSADPWRRRALFGLVALAATAVPTFLLAQRCGEPDPAPTPAATAVSETEPTAIATASTAPLATAEPAPTGEPTATAEPTAAASAPPIAPDGGRLDVTAVGGACRVVIQGTNHGPTPVSAIELAPGPVLVGCVTDRGTWLRTSVVVRAGETVSVTLRIEPGK